MKTGLAAALMAMLVLPTLIMAAGGYLLTRNTVCEESTGNSGAVLFGEIKQLAREFDDLEQVIRSLATQSPLSAVDLGPDGFHADKISRVLDEFNVKYHDIFDEFIIFDYTGQKRFPARDEDEIESDTLIRTISAGARTLMIHRVAHAESNNHNFWLYAPIGDSLSSSSGVLAGRVNATNLTRIASCFSVPGASRVFLLDGRQQSVIALAEYRKRQPRWTGSTTGLVAAFAGETGVKRYRDLAGREVIGAFTHLKTLDWAVLVEQDTDGDVAGLRGLRWKTIGLFGGLTVVCIIFALFMSRRIVRLLEHRDRQTAQQSEQLIAADKLATVGTMAASVAHEINNPLTTINVLIHNLFEESPPREPQRMDLQIALDEIAKIKNIILRFLEFARPQEPEFSEVQVNDVVHRFCQLIRHQTAAKEIKIVEHLDDHVPPVVADPSQIDQAILNILFNAIEATPVKGTIELSTTYTTERSVLVRVFNTGPELDPELHEKIFEPFFSTKAQGTGLGLSIVKMIMERHGGRVSAAPVAGRGTEFVLTLYTEKRRVEHG